MSESQGRIVIKEGIFEELDMLKERHAQMPLAMTNIAKQELDQLPEYIQSCSLVYIPEIGFLLAVKFWKPDVTDDELLQLENLQYLFKAKDTAHYKSATCLELDSMLGDILVKILELETRIALKLTQFIQENINPLTPLMRHIEELDCLIAMSKVARDNEFVKPNLVNDQVIDITEGRHPLQELYVNAFVPNNTVSTFEKGLVTILTGPNACGKSVYLKQIAIITYLAHIGSYVPAKHCTIGLVNHIHACLRTVESVTGFMSAFLIDLRQMSLSIYNSSPNSLIIVDEFGKGTNGTDGLAILASCIQHFIGRADKCPHLFVSTHYHTLADHLPSSPLIKLQGSGLGQHYWSTVI